MSMKIWISKILKENFNLSSAINAHMERVNNVDLMVQGISTGLM